jgi:hypothetical protein
MITGWALITITVFSTSLGFPSGDTGMVIHKIFETQQQCEDEKARFSTTTFANPGPSQYHECKEIR